MRNTYTLKTESQEIQNVTAVTNQTVNPIKFSIAGKGEGTLARGATRTFSPAQTVNLWCLIHTLDPSARRVLVDTAE